MNDIKKLYSLSKNLTVLYAEDDKNIQTTMHKYLKKLFKSVSVADDGLYGLELYEKERHDIVITDLSMPKMSGINMIKKIRQINPTQTVLVTTAHNESNFLEDTNEIGVDGYIIKPFDFSVLNLELQKIVEKIS